MIRKLLFVLILVGVASSSSVLAGKVVSVDHWLFPGLAAMDGNWAALLRI